MSKQSKWESIHRKRQRRKKDKKKKNTTAIISPTTETKLRYLAQISEELMERFISDFKETGIYWHTEVNVIKIKLNLFKIYISSNDISAGSLDALFTDSWMAAKWSSLFKKVG